MTTTAFLEKVYAGFLGMNIGIRLGAPVEPTLWTSERIGRFYGDIHSYVKDFKNFAADDDVNGPVYFLRALNDGALDRSLTPSDVAQAWLNYSREGVGMFWWGGYGVSTEHTAFLNLLHGIEAPASGSIQTNGKTLSEQIGAQIFIDTWGFIFPGDPKRASEYARIAASVSHDGEGLQGAAFIAGCIAQAFISDDIQDIVGVGLSLLEGDSTYAKVVRSVRDFHAQDPDDWRACLCYLQQEWGYDRYPGVCHIIPNAGVCIMALLYGKSFARGVEIATMAGWDTDCNAGNVGSILGVAGGLSMVPDHYRNPIGDMIVLSGISGYLNILDVPTYVKQLCKLSFQVRKLEIPQELDIQEGVIDFDFSLPGSTHGFRLSEKHGFLLRNEGNALAMLYDRKVRPQNTRLFYKPFYRRFDFDDERYMPVFSPTIYAGQTVSMSLRFEKFSGESITLSPYVRNTSTQEVIMFGSFIVWDEDQREITFTIDKDHPKLSGAMIDEVGLLFEANSPSKNRDFGVVFLERFTVSGKPDYTIDLAQQNKEFASITPFSHNHGSWELVKNAKGTTQMEVMALDHGEACTGNYFAKDVRVEGSATVHRGSSALISLRVQGARRGYYAGFHKGQLGIFKHENGLFSPLVSKSFACELDTTYSLTFEAKGTNLRVSVGGGQTLSVEDSSFTHGMVGYAVYEGGRVAFGSLGVKEMEEQI
ncbi:MAG: ADP-ribosylglycohydrolase family protein [Sphaerochaeta sp.]|nr:ADP-ribosylglycohydrolase family protein [Sphaerochaeta sp.]